MDFPNVLSYLEAKGKTLYSPAFKIKPDDHEIIYQLLLYFTKDPLSVSKYNHAPHKGIMLSGPVGCGKTSLMNLFRLMHDPNDQYIIKSCRDVSFEFNKEGYAVIHRYSKSAFDRNGQPKTYCFDDLGSEGAIKYFGNDCNAMAEILLSRHDLFFSRHMVTHLTTNLNSAEIESTYGLRVRSRLREMFNLISFPPTTKDKRT
jgi:hypothetical protein